MDTLQPPQNRPAQQAGTGYTNLSQYVNANQNNQLGQTVAGGVQQAGQAATGAINQAGQQFQQAAGTEQQRLSGLGQDVNNAIGNLGNIQQSDISNVQSALSGKGQGPTGLTNTGALQQQAQTAQQQGQATGSEMGRFGLLQNYVGKGQQYGLGQQSLDSALLGQTGQAQLGQARQATAGLGAQANRAIASANAQGQQLQNQAQQLQSNTQQQLGQAVTGYDQSMQQKVAQDQAAQQALIQQLSGTGGNAPINIDPNTLSQLNALSGGVLNAGTNLYNADLSPYLQANTTNLNAQGVQTAQDYAKIQALGQLAGNTGLAGSPQSSILQNYITNPTAVGTYANNSPLQISSQSGLADALNAASSQYNNAVAGQQGIISGQEANQNVDLQRLASMYLQNNPGTNPSDPYMGSPIANYQGSNQAQQALLNWAAQNTEQGANAPANGIGGTLAQYNTALAAQQAAQNQLSNVIPGQFNVLRTLNPAAATAPPAITANPILGNGGQPLTP